MTQADLDILSLLLERAQEMFTRPERVFLQSLLQQERARIASEQVTDDAKPEDGG